MENRIVWSAVDASTDVNLEYTKYGFLLRAVKDYFVDSTSIEIDTGISIKSKMPVCLIFDEYDGLFTIDEKFLILPPNESQNIVLNITGRGEDYFKIYKNAPFAYMLPVQNVFITMTQVNTRSFGRML